MQRGLRPQRGLRQSDPTGKIPGREVAWQPGTRKKTRQPFLKARAFLVDACQPFPRRRLRCPGIRHGGLQLPELGDVPRLLLPERRVGVIRLHRGFECICSRLRECRTMLLPGLVPLRPGLGSNRIGHQIACGGNRFQSGFHLLNGLRRVTPTLHREPGCLRSLQEFLCQVVRLGNRNRKRGNFPEYHALDGQVRESLANCRPRGGHCVHRAPVPLHHHRRVVAIQDGLEIGQALQTVLCRLRRLRGFLHSPCCGPLFGPGCLERLLRLAKPGKPALQLRQLRFAENKPRRIPAILMPCPDSVRRISRRSSSCCWRRLGRSASAPSTRPLMPDRASNS